MRLDENQIKSLAMALGVDNKLQPASESIIQKHKSQSHQQIFQVVLDSVKALLRFYKLTYQAIDDYKRLYRIAYRLIEHVNAKKDSFDFTHGLAVLIGGIAYVASHVNRRNDDVARQFSLLMLHWLDPVFSQADKSQHGKLYHEFLDRYLGERRLMQVFVVREKLFTINRTAQKQKSAIIGDDCFFKPRSKRHMGEQPHSQPTRKRNCVVSRLTSSS